MNIGFISWILDRQRTGIDNYLYNLITNMVKNGKSNEISLIHYKKTEDPIYEATNEILLPDLPKILKYSLALPYAIKKANLDILHVPAHWHNQLMPFYLNYNTKKVLTIHDLSPFTYPTTHNKQTVKLWGPTLKLIKKRIDNVIVDSNNTKNDCIKYLGIPEEKIKVIYLAADKIFKPNKDKENLQEYLKNKYEVKFPFILCVGTLEKRKNIPNLIKAFNKIKKTLKNYQLVIIGNKGWKYKSIFNTLNELNIKDDVIFTGYVPNEDLVKFYNTADLFVYPSIYEGFGLPPLEAMACGCPVITANTSSLPEVVGKAAITIDPYNVNELSCAMYKILINENLKTELSRKSLSQAKKFSWEKTASQTWKIYEEILNSE
jgi:glycosyltransferase involved in cell wall biosynthesis